MRQRSQCHPPFKPPEGIDCAQENWRKILELPQDSDGGSPADVTRLLRRCQEGDPTAEEQLFSTLYQHLREMARSRMRGVPPTDTLQPTALVHEAWLRLSGRQAQGISGRRHFFALASRAMHDIIVEQARKHGTRRRGGSWKRVEFRDGIASSASEPHDLLALSDALQALKASHPDSFEVVMLRFFGGLNHGEIAEAMGLALSKVRREWAYAKAWLHRRLYEPDSSQSGAGPVDGPTEGSPRETGDGSGLGFHPET